MNNSQWRNNSQAQSTQPTREGVFSLVRVRLDSFFTPGCCKRFLKPGGVVCVHIFLESVSGWQLCRLRRHCVTCAAESEAGTSPRFLSVHWGVFQLLLCKDLVLDHFYNSDSSGFSFRNLQDFPGCCNCCFTCKHPASLTPSKELIGPNSYQQRKKR